MRLTLIRKNTETPGVESFIFKPEESLVWKAGQYLHYVLHHEPTDERGSDRWFTAASAPFEGEVMITTRIAEKGSSFKSALQALQVGEVIEMSVVEGDFVIEDHSAEYIFIAGGIGITPFHSILKEADHSGTKLNVTLLYANRDTYIPFKAELDGFALNNPNLKINYITGQLTAEKIKEFAPDMQTPHFYISGPAPMVFALRDSMQDLGVPEGHIKLDDFPGYPAD